MPLDLKNVDYDWSSAFAVAADDGSIKIDPEKDIEEVIASVDGENETNDWQAIIKLKDGRYGWISAGCDYTGWDCQAGGTIHLAESLEKLLNPFVTPIWLDEDIRKVLMAKNIDIPKVMPFSSWDLDTLLSKKDV